MLLDASIEKQHYIEDCEVCCNPLEFKISFEGDELVEFQVAPAN
jgi:hypothetical protein